MIDAGGDEAPPSKMDAHSMAARFLVAGMCLVAVPLSGQPRPTERMHCDPSNPASKCPGPDCVCSEDVIEIVFDDTGTSVFTIEEPSLGTPVPMTVFIEVKSPDIWGWSYGVAHDQSRIFLESVSFDGTDAAKHFSSGFQVTTMKDIQTCLTADPKCSQSMDGGGYISACVLTIDHPVELPLGRSSISRAQYVVYEYSGSAAIQLTLSERLKRRGAPPVSINITRSGRLIQPRMVADGWIVSEGKRPFRRGDPDGDGRSSVSDSISLLLFLFLAGPLPACLEAADFDDDGRIDATDPISILRWLFQEGPPPAVPGHGLECGRDPEGSPVYLGCSEYGSC